MSYTTDNGFRRSQRIAEMNPVHYSRLELIIEDNVNQKFQSSPYNLRKRKNIDYSQYFDDNVFSSKKVQFKCESETETETDSEYTRRSLRIANMNKIDYTE